MVDDKTKIKNGLLIGLAVLVVVFLAFLGFSGRSFSVVNLPSGSFIGVPTYGYIQCDLSKQGTVTIPSSGYFQFSSKAFNCNDFTGNTLIQSCDVTLKTPTASEVTYANEVLLYAVCSTPYCDISNQNIIRTSDIGFKQTANLDKQITVHLLRGQYLVTAYQATPLIGSTIQKNSGYAKMTYTPYLLYRYDVFSQSNGQMISGTEDCTNGNQLSESNFLIESVSNPGTNILPTTKLDMNNIRSRGAQATFLSNFVAIPAQPSTFDGDTKYCYDKKVYAIETVELSGGMTYKIANTGTNQQLYSVDCCNNGDAVATSGSGYFCNNFKIEKLSSSTGTECSTINPCPIIGYQSLVGKQVASQSCVSGVCKTNYFTVKCNYAVDCPNGYCDIDSSNPLNNKCVYPSPQNYCGNGVCDASYGETTETCPKDCIKIQPGTDLTFIYITLSALIVIMIMLIVVVSRQGKGTKRRR